MININFTSFIVFAFLACSSSLLAQERGINYQAVIQQDGTPIANSNILTRITLLLDGTPEYQEEQQVTTDSQGQFSLVIGEGQTVFSGLDQVNWDDPRLELQVEIDPAQEGYTEISRQVLQAVPFSFMAERSISAETSLVAERVKQIPDISLDSLVDVNASDLKEGQVLKWNGRNWANEDDSNIWEKPSEDAISYTGKIGLNVANPIFDLQSAGNFFHEGFLQVSNNTFPALRLRHEKQQNVFPKNIMQFTISQEQGQGTLEYTTNSFAMKKLDADGNASEIYLHDNGNVGINKATPSESLEVEGALRLGNTNNTNEGTIRWTGTDFQGRKGSNWVSLTHQSTSIWNKGTEEGIFFDGPIGIGTNNPDNLLTIRGNVAKSSQVLIETEGSGDAFINLGIAKTAYWAMGVDDSDGDKFKLVYGGSSPSTFEGSNLLTIQNNGNVGLGTNNPARKFSLSFNSALANTSLFLIEQRGSGDAFMNFKVNTTSYAMGIDNSDGDKFKIGVNPNGTLDGVAQNTLMSLDQNGNLAVDGEVRSNVSGSANLVPIAYGQFIENGNIVFARSTNNFTVKRERAGEYLIELPDFPIGSNYLIIATVGNRGAPKIAQSNPVAVGLPQAGFRVKTYVLPTTILSDATVSFAIYRP